MSDQQCQINRQRDSPNTKLATAAVKRLLAHSKRAWFRGNSPLGIQPITMANMDARKPTTVAWA